MHGWRTGRSAFLALTFGVAFVAACSSSSSGGSGGGSCDSVCNKTLSLKCPNDNLESCKAECQQTFDPMQAQCASQVSSYLGCAESHVTLVCGPDGKAGTTTSISTVCKSEAAALTGCSACLASSNDTACDTCRKTACCAEWKTYSSDPSVVDFSNCATACTDTACIDGCYQQYPSVKPKFDAVTACTTSKCASSC